jgi:uncharacterized protein (DUF2384 family)
MRTYFYTFIYQGQAVTYRIMARNKNVANRIARVQERTWRLAVDVYQREQSSWS